MLLMGVTWLSAGCTSGHLPLEMQLIMSTCIYNADVLLRVSNRQLQFVSNINKVLVLTTLLNIYIIKSIYTVCFQLDGVKFINSTRKNLRQKKVSLGNWLGLDRVFSFLQLTGMITNSQAFTGISYQEKNSWFHISQQILDSSTPSFD